MLRGNCPGHTRERVVSPLPGHRQRGGISPGPSLKPLARLALHALDCDHRARGIHLRLLCMAPYRGSDVPAFRASDGHLAVERTAPRAGIPVGLTDRQEGFAMSRTLRTVGLCSLREARLHTVGRIAVQFWRSACPYREEPEGFTRRCCLAALHMQQRKKYIKYFFKQNQYVNCSRCNIWCGEVKSAA